MFERGAAAVGLDFLAHPFWDKYLEFEDRLEAQDRIFVILGRIVHIPMHQYARYFEKFRQLAHTRPLNELLPTETLAQYRDEVQAASTNYPVPPKSDLEVEREIRAKVDSDHMRVFTRTQTETTKRWTYESEIKRPYFHVTELEVHQLVNWRKYLDFEEAEGDYSRVQFLYERCLVTCAFYDEFWFRYARWMHAQEGREEEVRNIYQRASTLFVPISKPGIRLQYAYFEESTGRTEVAQDIHEAILLRLPGHVETIVSWANLQRRQSGLEAAAKVYNDQLGEPLVGLQSRAALVVELACLHWKYDGSAAKARQIFQDHMQSYADSLFFWEKYLLFEIEQPTSAATETEQYAKISGVFDSIRELGNLSLHSVRELSHYYLEYLLNRGSKTAMKEFLRIDRDINGPASVQATKKSGKSAMAIVIDEEQQRHDEEQQRQGEVRYGKYFQIPELIEDAQVSILRRRPRYTNTDKTQNPTQLASFN